MNQTNDEGDIMFNTFQYLNNQSIYLKFNTSDFDVVEINRSQQGDITSAQYQLHEKLTESFLARVPYQIIDNPNQVDLQVSYNQSDDGEVLVKAVLHILNTNTGLDEVIEVT